MPSSPIRRLVPLADEAKRRGVTVYHLNIGQPDIPTPQVMLDVYRNHQIKVLAYGHSGGLLEYRANLARFYTALGIPITREQVLVTTAGSEAVIFALLSICDPGDEVLVPEPFYTNYNGFAVQTSARVVPVPCRAEDGYALPPLDEFRARLTPRTRAVLICNPCNPTGHVYTRQELEALRDLAVEHDLFLLSDEVYREFVYDGETHCSLMHIEGLDERAILLDSVSKRYSACGARIGCLVTRSKEVRDAALRFGQARLCPPTLDQMAANAALSTPPEYFVEMREEYQKRRDAAFEALVRMPGVSGIKPKGAFYAMIRLPVDDANRFCTWLLSDFSDHDETVMLAPGNGFYANPADGLREVRLAYVLNVPAMRRAMELLAKALATYPGRLSA